KAMMLEGVGGLTRPQSGTVQRIAASDGGHRALIVSQEHNLFPWMTVLENAAFGLEMSGVPKAERRERALELLRRFGMAGWDRFYPGELSLGMKQRVAVIRSFL